MLNQSSVFMALARGAKFNKSKVKASQFNTNKASLVEKWKERQEDKADAEDDEDADATGYDDNADARRFFKIRVKGTNVPGLLLDFKDLEVADDRLPLLENIEESRFKEPTAVQMQTIPAVLAKRDVLAVAPTGSGKTASYLIPQLASLSAGRSHKVEGEGDEESVERQAATSEAKGVHTLVIIPTHELGDQIVREHDWLSAKFPRHLRRACALTKANREAVREALNGKSFYSLVAATPLLLIETLEKLDGLAQVNCVVFDEADRLFEPTFVEQTDGILAKLREENQQRLMLSATMPSRIEKLAKTVLRDSLKITIGTTGRGADTIEQKFIYAGTEEGKMVAFRRLLREGTLAPPALIFVDSKDRAKEICRDLMQEGIRVDAMHGERSPAQRDALVLNFREGKLWFLVATELLARGVDFRGTNTVINWDSPNTPVSYIHRIGRCGRAGRRGVSVTFFTDDDAQDKNVRAIANVVKNSGFEVADWILKLRRRQQPAVKKGVEAEGEKTTKKKKKLGGKKEGHRQTSKFAKASSSAKRQKRAKNSEDANDDDEE